MESGKENRRGWQGVTRRGLAFTALVSAATGAAAYAALAQNDDDNDDSDKDDDAKGGDKQPPPPTPEENYAKRFPQRVHVSDVLGKPILDDDNAVIARVRSVVRTGDGKIEFIVPYGGLFGIGGRLVAVPIETLASIGTALLALDFPKEKFRQAPSWYGVGDQILGPDAEIRVAVARR